MTIISAVRSPSTGEPSLPLSRDRDNHFNLLRLLFATLVLLSHSPEMIDGDKHRELFYRASGTMTFGGFAVSGFFLISGYLIVKSWHRRPRLGSFLLNRVLRIYPAFIVSTLLCVLVVPLLVVDARPYFHALKPLSVVAHAIGLRPPVVPPVFDLPYADLNGAMWTIAYEFRCYVLVAIVGVCGFVHRRFVWLGITAIFVTLALFTALTAHQVPTPVNYLIGEPAVFVAFAAVFCVGGCFYLFFDRLPLRTGIVLLSIVPLYILLRDQRWSVASFYTFVPYLIFWLAFLRVPVPDRLKTAPDISYGLYLYGWPVQKLVIHFYPGISPWLLFPVALAISAVCGYLSWHLVEKWFLRLKAKKPASPSPDAPPATALTDQALLA